MLVETPIYDSLLLSQYEFEPTLRCEGELHSQGVAYHTPDQPGEFFAIAPCCGARAVLCRSRVEYLTGPTVAEIRCQRCDLKHPPHTYSFELIV